MALELWCLLFGVQITSGVGGIRTRYLFIANEAFYQVNYDPSSGAPGLAPESGSFSEEKSTAPLFN